MILQCDNCGFPILGVPARLGERVYCCADCAAGGPCNCNYTLLRQQTTEVQWLLPRSPDQIYGHEISVSSQ